MIGYNFTQIKTLLTELAGSYATLGQAIETGWSDVDATIYKEWVGPDAISFEEKLKARMIELYASCKESVSTMVVNVSNIANSWIEFQKSNIIEGAELPQTMSITINPSDYTIQDHDLSTLVISKHSLDGSEKLGITNGEKSATYINNAVNSYVNEIGKTVKKIYETCKTSDAFLGKTQAQAIEKYLTNMAGSFSNVVTQVKDMQDTLKTLVANYNSQMQSFAESVGNINTNVTTQ